MAERLTEVGMFIDTPVYIIKNGKKSEAVDKLAQLENILEKYGIEGVEELKDALENKIEDISNPFLQGYVRAFFKDRLQYVEFERDIWKRACELACKWFKQTGFIGDQTEVDYYYQQAKKEGEQK